MKMISQLPTAICFVVVATVGCRDSKKKVEVVNVAQDTMLLRDLAEANRNTASATAMDNSLNTIRTTGGDSLAALVNQAAQPRTVVRPSPGGSDALTSTPRPTVPLTSSDAPHPITAPNELSPASGASSGDPCDSPATTDQRSCLNRSIVQNDADLNRTYQDLLSQSRKSGGPELEQRFRQSQRDWVVQRDADCRGAGDGALWARARARCLAEQSDRRVAELRRNLNSLRGQ